MGINDGILGLLNVAKENPIGTAIGAAGAGAIVGLGTAALIGKAKRRKSKRNKNRSSRKRNNRNKRNKKKYYPEPRGKKYSRRKIRYTKKGQPYVIMSSGKARFIKKSSAKRSKKQKGGRY